MTNNALQTSQNPSSLGVLPGVLQTAITKSLQRTDGKLPAKIISYNRTTNRASVQPLINVVDTAGNQIQRAPISSIPVLQLGGGGYLLSFNLQQGDLGWIEANDRDISLFLQYYALSAPNTFRIKSFSDAVFVPDVMRGYEISSEDSENTVLQSLDGSVKISLGSDTITVVAPNVVIGGTDSTTITGDLSVEGDVLISGTLDVTDACTLGTGGVAIARVGDNVAVNIATGLGTITSGSLVNTSI